jgi:hypothetical protein
MTRHATWAVSSGPALLVGRQVPLPRAARSALPLHSKNPQSEGGFVKQAQPPTSTVTQGSIGFPVGAGRTSFRKGRTVDQPGIAVDRAPSPLVRNASRGLAASSPGSQPSVGPAGDQPDRQDAATGNQPLRAKRRGPQAQVRAGTPQDERPSVGRRPLRGKVSFGPLVHPSDGDGVSRK